MMVPGSLVAALVAADRLNDNDLAGAVRAYQGDDFLTFATGLDFDVVACASCDDPLWSDDSHGTEDGSVCEGCFESYYYCDGCEEYTTDDVTSVGEGYYCDSCLFRNFTRCDSCRDWTEETTTTLSDREVCEGCLEDYTYCEECDGYGDGEHTHSCDCEAPHRHFLFPHGTATVEEDERFAVTLPGGVVDEVGIAAIVDVLLSAPGIPVSRSSLYTILDDIGPEWQKRTGNLTKRLSKALYAIGVKLSPEIVSSVGNVARAHSSSTSEWHLEVTRNLNLDADAFYHDSSCWWGSYSKSRCALKNWGGIGLRSYVNDSTYSDCPSGRAWVQPLTEDMTPTHNISEARAFLVYNGYGNLEGFAPARIIAQMVGMSYRKVEVSIDPQYVNNNAGYLVADQATCDRVESISYEDDEHNTMDARTLRRGIAA